MVEELEAVLEAIRDALAGIQDERVVAARDAAEEAIEVEGDPDELLAVLKGIRDALAGIEDDWVVAARRAAEEAVNGDPEGAALSLRGDLDEHEAVRRERRGLDL